MRRQLFNLSAAGSLFLFAATVALWVRGNYGGHAVGMSVNSAGPVLSAQYVGLTAGRGRVGVIVSLTTIVPKKPETKDWWRREMPDGLHFR